MLPSRASAGSDGAFPLPDVTSAPSSRPRIASLDVMRGLVMVLMTLEHVRNSITWQAKLSWGNTSPLGAVNPASAFPDATELFFTIRWISNFCAPVFIFLAGVSIYLWHKRRGPDAPISSYLLKRGLLLIGLNFLIKTSAPLSGNPLFELDVLWPIGLSMMLIALSIRLPVALLWCVGLGLVCLHNLFDASLFAGVPGRAFWSLAFFPSSFELPWGGSVMVRYPFAVWYGVMLLGYLCGPLFLETRQRLLQFCLIAGGMLLLFLVLRFTQVYGDPKLWTTGYDEGWKDVASFLNTTKYPPSLLYLLFNGSLMFFFIAFADRFAFAPRLLLVLGRSPTFYYVVHYMAARGTAKAISMYSGPWADALRVKAFSPGGIFVISAGIMLALYPCCVWLQKRAARQRRRKACPPPVDPKGAPPGAGMEGA